MRDMEARSAVSAATLRHLEDKLKDKEVCPMLSIFVHPSFTDGPSQATIARLEQEKSKLETYARRSLSTFKERYMQALQALKVRSVAHHFRFNQL